ncbi:cytochrome c-type biogenesis protein CcmH [Tamilnaduibacter salinus]|uniref:Cytochrome c-type biogenesis protein n=1 Tax=Tamilnaduibacter salinus TaxID=1484056 RepID=A0A2A2I5M9_9GAMM|nr:cytochrome c-type biogenesis protein [Tamilnaduibacter salinus]PAV26445.1 cytochrome c-type biogenesis protein CcmH [Tamilnaduibacter salinus]PVY79290.1 cytochrome c-type biogenesis protein CcmH [Tamilnaduibacter salinus]
MRAFCLLALLLVTLNAAATSATYQFESEADRERFRTLTSELRCPKCQNQAIADSNAPIASDMREQVHRMVVEGRSNDAIMEAMVSRFGEFVRYRPQVEPRTWLLWLTPLIAVGVGLIVIGVLLIRSSRRSPESSVLSEEDRQRADALLNGSPRDD